jgi:hypothetical protein
MKRYLYFMITSKVQMKKFLVEKYIFTYEKSIDLCTVIVSCFSRFSITFCTSKEETPFWP